MRCPPSRGDELVGSVTSGAWGFRVGASLGMGSVRSKGGVKAEWLRVGGWATIEGLGHIVENIDVFREAPDSHCWPHLFRARGGARRFGIQKIAF